MTPIAHCHCGRPGSYGDCCRLIVSGELNADTAETLMRARYSAYVERDAAYLRDSWHRETRPSRVSFHSEQRWLGLKIKSTGQGGFDDVRGTVEFVARYKIQGKGHRLHELSRFEKIDGKWYYLDGDHL